MKKSMFDSTAMKNFQMDMIPLFLYQAYGSLKFRKQAILSIQSLINLEISPKRICVFTDNPDDFTDISGVIIPATDHCIRKWQGNFSFHHRLKIELIQYVFNKFGGPLIYIDSDTIWLKNPERICNLLKEGFLIMHEKENTLSKSFHPEYLTVLKENKLLEKEGFFYNGEEVIIYNAGVVGLPEKFNSEILEQIKIFCDLLSINLPNKMEWVEQLAFSYILAKAGKIETCEKDILHYWRESFEFYHQIKNYSKDDLLKLCQNRNQINFLVSKGRGLRRSFENQFLLRFNRLRRSFRKRKSKMLVLREILKQKFSRLSK